MRVARTSPVRGRAENDNSDNQPAPRCGDMQEKRRFHRIRPRGGGADAGTIFVDLKSPATPCVVFDLSAGGASIEVHGKDAIPKKFILNHGGVKKTCRVMWQKGRRVGVAF